MPARLPKAPASPGSTLKLKPEPTVTRTITLPAEVVEVIEGFCRRHDSTFDRHVVSNLRRSAEAILRVEGRWPRYGEPEHRTERIWPEFGKQPNGSPKA